MRLSREIRAHAERLATAPRDELGRWARFARFHLELWRFCGRRLWEHNVMAMSAALSFRTIFAMIPTLVLMVLILKSLGVLADGKQSLRTVLANSGFSQITVVQEAQSEEATAASKPSREINVAEEIERLVTRVEMKLSLRRIGPVGVVLLVWTAITLLTTIERSLNRIFGAQRARALTRRLLLYWSVITLGPLLWIAASYAGGQLRDAVSTVTGVSWLLGAVGWASPIVVGVLVVAAIYELLPNTSVGYRAAIAGALVSVPIWLLAKWGFGIYVSKLVATGNLYGALGLLPLFLVWLNLSWTIFLFGAELANAAANLSNLQVAEAASDTHVRPAELLAVTIAVVQPFHYGQGPVGAAQIAARLALPRDKVDVLLDRLTSLQLLCAVETEDGIAFVPARPADKIRLGQILDVDDQPKWTAALPEGQSTLATIVDRACATAASALQSRTLADVIDDEGRR
ncbi:MAG TPA: YhjD/YihY/BrkB family envelope integrity protein [Phycisphaerae bacterium]|nr:YhjD/YihY/BrkB family envelope integrity protein [Phycisphaerae bacterium]